MSTLQAYKQPYKEKSKTTGMLVLTYKIGDQQVSSGSYGYRHLELIDYVDYEDWVPDISDHHAKVFQTVIVGKAKLSDVIAAIEWNSSCKDPTHKNFGSNNRWVLKQEISVYDGVRDLWDNASAVKPFVDAEALDFKSICEKQNLGEPSVIDVNAISSGTYTIGSGGDYATGAAFSADISSPVTGNLTGNMISNTTETVLVNLGKSLASFELRLDGNGYTMTFDINGSGLGVSATGPGTLTVINLVTNATSTHSGRYQIATGSASADPQICICQCEFNGNSQSATAFGRLGGTATITIDACAAYDFTNDAFQCANSSNPITIRHCTMRNNDIGADLASSASEVINSYAYSNTTADFAAIASATGNYCYSDDATAANANWGTGTNCSANRTPANDFDDVNTMVPVRGGGLAAGATTSVTESINGVAIPNAGDTVYIGAKAQTTLVDLSGATLTPDSGAAAGGTTVSVSGATGLGLSGGSCQFGANAGTVDSHDNTDATVESPAGSGTVDFTFENSDGESDTLASAFEYLAATARRGHGRVGSIRKIGLGF